MLFKKHLVHFASRCPVVMQYNSSDLGQFIFGVEWNNCSLAMRCHSGRNEARIVQVRYCIRCVARMLHSVPQIYSLVNVRFKTFAVRHRLIVQGILAAYQLQTGSLLPASCQTASATLALSAVSFLFIYFNLASVPCATNKYK